MADIDIQEIDTESHSGHFGPKPIDSNHPLAQALDKSHANGGTEVTVRTSTPKSVVNFLRRYGRQQDIGVRVKAFDDHVVFKAASKRKTTAEVPEDDGEGESY